MRAFLKIAIVLLIGMGLGLSAASAGDKKGTIKVTVNGTDGKPSDTAKPYQSAWNTDPGWGTKGLIMYVSVHEGDNKAYTVVYVPDGQEVPVTLDLKPKTDLHAVEKAEKAVKDGNLDAYNEAVTAANLYFQEEQQFIDTAQAAVDAWVKDNDVPTMTLQEVKQQLKAAQALGTAKKSGTVETLNSYKTKLTALDIMRTQLEKERQRLTVLKPPEKKTTMLPSTCPDGQSGGLLAGFINSVTGTNSVEGICGEEPEKDNKDRHDKHEHEHDHD